jgi:hypothetical protein
MRTGDRLNAPLGAALIVALAAGALTGGAAAAHQTRAPGPDPEAALRARLPARRVFNHAMEVRREYHAQADVTRAWIESNEDDLRLYTPAGALNDMMMQVSYYAPGRPPGGIPLTVTLSIQTNGDMPPGPRPHHLELRADGRPIRLEETPTEPVRSGALVFLATSAVVPIDQFLALIEARAVEGRCWGHPFELAEKHLEVLRDMAAGMAGQ